MKNLVNKFFLYGVGGGIAFLITFFTTYFLTEKLHIYYLISAITGYILGLFFNFSFQAYITFKTKNILFLYRFIKFSIFQLVGLLVYSFLLFLFTDIFKIYYLISLILTSGIVYIINFLLSKNLVFK